MHQTKLYRKQHTYFMHSNFFPKIVSLMR